jgi:hypothetical protein
MNIISLNYSINITKNAQSNTYLSYLSQNLLPGIVSIDYNLKMNSVTKNLRYKTSSVNLSLICILNQVTNIRNNSKVTISTIFKTSPLKKWRNRIRIRYLSIKYQESKSGFILNSRYSINFTQISSG